MERVMSVEERIRRAEDIYNRRNGVQRMKTSSSKVERNKKASIKKMLMQIFVCLSIYIIFYTVTNREHIFSEEFREEVNVFFGEKINEWFENMKDKISGFFVESTNNEIDNKVETDDKSGINSNSEIDSKEEKSDENIGGSKEDEKDNEIEEIKSKISFITPINGKISSSFGWRNPTTSTVSKYHTGIDIAATEGTVIKSATDGKIILASDKGDYGNHYQIQVEDIILVYAHCKKLYFKEGESVKQGQEIAEVGTTGNSTGPHLHFEIRKGNEKIDPQLILTSIDRE